MNFATFAEALHEKERRKWLKNRNLFNSNTFHKRKSTHTHTHTKLYSIIRNIIVTDSRQKLTICDRLSNEKLSPYLSTIFTLYILFPSLDLSKQKFKSKLRGEEETSSTTAIKNVGLGGQGRWESLDLTLCDLGQVISTSLSFSFRIYVSGDIIIGRWD